MSGGDIDGQGLSSSSSRLKICACALSITSIAAFDASKLEHLSSGSLPARPHHHRRLEVSYVPPLVLLPDSALRLLCLLGFQEGLGARNLRVKNCGAEGSNNNETFSPLA